MNSTTFSFNFAHRGGVVHLEKNSTYVAYQSNFDNNGGYY